MRTPLFVACLVVSILVNAAIIDSASLGDGSVRQASADNFRPRAGELDRLQVRCASSLEALCADMAWKRAAIDGEYPASPTDAERRTLRGREVACEDLGNILVATAVIGVASLQ